MIAIIDYGAANLLSITRALETCGASVRITDRPDEALAAEGVVLPGVGAAGTAMARLCQSGMDEALRQVAAEGRPLLGLCLGMQLFFERLEEDDATGLGILPGEVRLLSQTLKIPHMGWNTIEWTPGAPETGLFAGLEPGIYTYFVHSYHCLPENALDGVAWTDYGGPVCAAVARGNTYGFQFHPEKSGAPGLRMLRAWLARTGVDAEVIATSERGGGA